MSGHNSRQRSPEDQSLSRSQSMFGNQQGLYPGYFPDQNNVNQQQLDMQNQSQQQHHHQQQQQQHQNQALNLSSPPVSLSPNYSPHQQQVDLIGNLGNPLDLNQINQGFSNFNVYDQSSPPAQVIDPSFLFGNQQQPQTLDAQGLMGSNLSSGMMQPLSSNGGNDWNTASFQSFRGHQRALSEHSDVSPHLSPYIQQQDTFDQPSPLLVGNPGEMTAFLQGENFGLDQFTLNDPPNGISPHHSPLVSPHLTPQHTGNGGLQPSPYALPEFSFLGTPDMPNDSNMGLGLQSGNERGYDQLMVEPPSIEVQFAPPQRQPTFPGKLVDETALSPPLRGKPLRQRSKSDPPLLTIQNPSRPSSPMPPGPPQHSQSYTDGQRRNSLHPSDVPGNTLLSSGSTLSSHGSSTSVNKHARRSSTSAIPNRDYILDLAAPSRPGASSTDTKRVQKHPATFQCTLCPKRFTRAYNLRSHLRTHTDERPFVCTVCGKAFARQHDRKRHESLHSGEKKFVCKGDLKGGGHWGCGRRFARADALGRHFRSEAGRICIKPLLDEESADRVRLQNESNLTPAYDYSVLHQLPLALIQQYPALASAWEGLASMDEDEDRRGSFDMSSGGEYDDAMGDHRNSYDGGFSRDDWSGSDQGWGSDTGEMYQSVSSTGNDWSIKQEGQQQYHQQQQQQVGGGGGGGGGNNWSLKQEGQHGEWNNT